MIYTPDELEMVRQRFRQVPDMTLSLATKYASREYASDRTREFVTRGFIKRFYLLQHCLIKVFALIPLGQTSTPDGLTVQDAEIYIQAFVLNAYGCVDNIAWIWVAEKSLALKPWEVGLFNEMKARFSTEFQNILKDHWNWFQRLKEFRHALAHQIPVQIGWPGEIEMKDRAAYTEILTQKQKAKEEGNRIEETRLEAERRKLVMFVPVITHSWLKEGIKEAAPKCHGQLVEDFYAIHRIAVEMLEELNRKSTLH